MRNKTLFILWAGILITALFGAGFSCQKRSNPREIEYYTCVMHPQIKREQPGQCPICGMDLVPVYREQDAGTPETHAHGDKMSASAPSLKIDPQRIQRIGVQTEAVGMRDLKKQLVYQGKAAHDPELWVAEKEYLIARQLGDPSLIRSSEEKLIYLGLSQDWIREIRKRFRVNQGFYLPEKNAPTLLEAYIPQGDIPLIQPGQELEILDLQSRALGKGTVRALGTILDPETRTLRALVVAEKNLSLQPNSFVQLRWEMDLGKRLSVPKNAVLFNGDHNMVYVETAPGEFAGRSVELGQAGEDFYEVLSGLQEGEKVVTNGTFLIDSETQIRSGSRGGHHH